MQVRPVGLSCRVITLQSLDRQLFKGRCFLPQLWQWCARVNWVSDFHSVSAWEGRDRVDLRFVSGVGKVDLSLSLPVIHLWAEFLVLTSVCCGNLWSSKVLTSKFSVV